MNGYAEINLKGQTVGLKFGMRALPMIQEKAAQPGVNFFDQVGEQKFFNEFGYAYIFYAGYCNQCIVKQTIAVIPFEEFYEYAEQAILNKVNDEEFKNAYTQFSESQVVTKTAKAIKELQEEEQKKT